MSHSCSSQPQSAVFTSSVSPTLYIKPLHHLEHSTGCATTPIPSCPAPPTPDSVSSPRNSTLNNPPFSSSQPSRSPSPPPINVNSSPKCISSLHSNPISMSTNQVVTRPLKPQENGTASSYSLSTSVLPKSLPYSISCPNGLQFSCDHMFPDSSDSQSSLSPDTPSHNLPGTNCTPNVYINGLPPNFPEQELFALARPFGEVKSVRSFTRHVSEKPTGYGFVLFNDIDSATRCIEGLRKYRNLHPSFSKQLHRIPGTAYAEQSPSLIEHDEDSFKARMEKLKDESSTNLYIEGLPLTIDEESLGELVYPYAIKSSRFFKTKLSEPPRMIAFVRLESRRAAQDTIDRLHGRMVCGLDDPGCRISVRFADSAEQRELRRSERLGGSGDQSTARLTMAEAALLNLRGQELRSQVCKAQLSHVRDTSVIDQPRGEISQSITHHSYPNLNLNLASVSAGSIPVSTSLPGHFGYPYGSSHSARYEDLPSKRRTDDLFLSLQQNLHLRDAYTIDQENDHRLIQRVHLQPPTNGTLYSENTPVQQPRNQVQARNGFTPAEELILQAHARLREQQQYQQLQAKEQLMHPRDCTVARRAASGRQEPGRKLNANAQVFQAEQTAAYSLAARAQGGPSRSKFLGDALPPISEDDFHVLGQRQLDSMSHYEHLRTRYQEELQFRGDAGNVMVTKRPSRAIEIVAPLQHLDTKSSSQSHHRPQLPSRSHPSLQQPAQARDRPVTLPRSLHASGSSQHTYQHMGNRSNSLSSSTASSHNDKPNSSPNYCYAPEASRPRSDSQEDGRACNNYASTSSKAYVPMEKSPSLCQQLSSENDTKSPTLVSPALTYSSHTPSTLSPATPFLGSFSRSFGGSPETFEYGTADGEVVEKVKMGSSTH